MEISTTVIDFFKQNNLNKKENIEKFKQIKYKICDNEINNKPNFNHNNDHNPNISNNFYNSSSLLHNNYSSNKENLINKSSLFFIWNKNKKLISKKKSIN